MEFSDIALAKFLQSFPELGNLIIAFKDVSDELSDETDIQVGIFILRAGIDLFFVPVVSKSDNVYPIDSIFINSKSKFMPLTKKVVEMVINSQQLNPGTMTKIPQTVPVNPSVYDLINPPRTGKFVYASSSRLIEFLADIPNQLKDYVKDRLTEDKGVYSKLNDLFGLEPILSSLQHNPQHHQPTVGDSGISVITGGNDMGQQVASEILRSGYAILGEQKNPRIAVNAEDYSRMGKIRTVGMVDGGHDYEVIMKSGNYRSCYVPKTLPYNMTTPNKEYGPMNEGERVLAIFENGDYAITDSIVAAGEPKDGNEVIQNLFSFRPPVLLRDLNGEENFAVFDRSFNLVGVYGATGTVTLSHYGASIRATDLRTYRSVSIIAYRNFKDTPVQHDNDVYIPSSSLVIPLGKNISYDLEVNTNSAQKKRSLGELLTLGASLDLGYDGVEFSVNGKPAGAEPNVIHILVVGEGLAPNAAQSFVKQAKEQKRVKIYLSKKADFEPGEIPQYGDQAPEQVDNFGANLQNFTPNVTNSLDTNDGQIVESSIIAELLQTPDLYEKISEYLPDIEEAIDKLGRVLFLSRVHIDRLSEANDADNVFAFLASLKNVYKTLGDTFIKLQQLSSNVVQTA